MTPAVGLRTWIGDWPVYRQLAGEDKSGLGAAVRSSRTARLRPRVEAADSVVRSVCPYCAVGCGQTVFIRDGKVVQIEGALDNEENYLIKKLAGEGNDQNS